MILIIKLLFSKSDEEGALGRGLWVLLRKWSLSFRYVIFIISYQNSVLLILRGDVIFADVFLWELAICNLGIRLKSFW